jgi:LmbE family N-acetylglucosaminyl deacetylase
MADTRGAARHRAVFVSPHLDDAVFSCGERIASEGDAVAVTLFAGRPPRGSPLTGWGADCAFVAGDDVIGTRRAEGREALGVLGAQPLWLDFRDDQYGGADAADDAAHALADTIAREHPGSIYFPLGLFHRDHRRASEAALALLDRIAAPRWYAYEDAIYRRLEGLSGARRQELRSAGYRLERTALPLAADAPARKRAAVACYRSQLRGLRMRSRADDLFAPEAYWRVTRVTPWSETASASSCSRAIGATRRFARSIGLVRSTRAWRSSSSTTARTTAPRTPWRRTARARTSFASRATSAPPAATPALPPARRPTSRSATTTAGGCPNRWCARPMRSMRIRSWRR